ncbi:MAG TPA: alanine racemase, partial [Rhizomicrobium sp.]
MTEFGAALRALTGERPLCDGPRHMGNHIFDAARLTVRLGAIAANYQKFRALSGRAIVAGVVKADGYGCGAAQAAKTLLKEGCDTFFVARLSEGVALRPVVGNGPRIFVLDGVQADGVPALIAHRLTPVLNSLDQMALWSAAARDARTTFDAAVHIDTGMNRLGLSADELSIFAAESKARLANLNLVLRMSHLACADDSESDMNREQFARFRSALATLPSAPASFASSGGVLLGKDYVFDMVRPGIGLYGGNPQSGKPNPFATVALMTGRILQLRRVDSGGSVGYGATFQIGRKTVLATVALGYADGLMRAMSNNGFGAIAGHRAPIAGRVSMDLVTLDVTDVPQASLMTG